MFSHLIVAEKDQASSDSLDVYMENVGSQLDKGRKAEIKHRLHELRKVSQSMGLW